MPKNKRIFIPIALVVILVLVGLWYGLQNITHSVNGALEASGTVEAEEVLIAAEIGGRVAEVLAVKGSQVTAGEPLIRLEAELLQTQQQQASAALDSSLANLAAAKTSLDMAQVQLQAALANQAAADAAAQAELISAQVALDNLQNNAGLAYSEALRQVAIANRTVYDAQYMLDNFTIPSNQAGLDTLEAINLMKQRLDTASANFEPYKSESSTNPNREDLKNTLDEARSDYNAAVKRLEYESALQTAQALVEKTLLDLDKVKDGPDPDQQAILEARIAAVQAVPQQTSATVEQANFGIAAAEAKLMQAQAAVHQAQAQLDLVNEQIKKLVVYAPVSGVVLSRNIEAGEVIQPGVTVMTIGQLDRLTITVYIPEDRYGQVKLGMKARVTVDSFPGQRFEGEVIYIAGQAEFTPRNVQTVEGRRTTVFAVQLSVSDPEGKLKPGMPADVVFIR